MQKSIFPSITLNNLTEYAADSALESYTGIVLDPEDQIFKTVTGQFHDKKDFYEKLTKRGYVVRKVFEKKVFDWIEENAKTTIEAYLMFSTAFSKWKGNNLLDPYYVKLLNDIPQLNREKIKGDPNSIGTQKTEESALTETWENVNIEGIDTWGKHKVTVIDKNNPTNQLDIFGVRFSPAVKQLLDTYNDPKSTTIFRKVLTKYFKTSPEFVRAVGKELNPGNRDTVLQFYDPKKDAKSSEYIEGSGRNPTQFYITIDDVPVKDTDGSNVVFTNTALLNWYRDLGYQNFDIYKPDAINVLKAKQLRQSRDKEDALLGAAGDLEKSLDILNKDEITSKNTKDALYQLLKTDIPTLAQSKNWSNYISQEDHDKVEEFKKDVRMVFDKNTTPDQRKKLYAKYGADEQQSMLNNLNKQSKDFYAELADRVYIPTSIDEQIALLQDYIKDVETTDLSDNQTKLEKLLKLRNNLGRLIALKNTPQKSSRPLKTHYDSPETSPVNASRTGYINLPKGAKAKYNITQDDLGVNQGIHSFGKESNWNTVINELKETGIPQIVDIKPIRHVNYNASGIDSEIPLNGITNPSLGCSFQTGGTFISEEDQSSLDSQWGNRAHDTLNPDLFDNMHLKPEVREALLRIAKKFQTTLGLSIEPVDVYFTGSSANYNYNELSDIDLHLVYDFERIGINAEILSKYFIAKKQVFNNDYDITVKGLPVELGVENLNEPIVSSAIYSLVDDQWMLKPKDAEHLLPRPDMKQYYALVQKIEDAIESRNSQKIGEVWDELYKIRKDSLAVDGEYGHGNSLFKKLRNLGYLDRLKHAYYSSASEELSLEALKEII